MTTDPVLTFRCLALTTRRDPFPRVSVQVDCAENVISTAIAHIYALHGMRVVRQQVLVERMVPFTPPSPYGGRVT